MSQSKIERNEHETTTHSEADAALRRRKLSDAELASVAGGVKQDPDQPQPPPPGGKH